ncbi:MAG: hypothetical protein JWN53_1573, partial [Gemmatimonadetes bacterium]|nr:hypothetical protein [Gemmatimonadota bacterium]
RLRDALARGDFPAALAWREDDELLRTLNSGIAAYYASQFQRSAALLDSAALLSDQRMTTSVSRQALSVVTNDMARPYEPRRTERLLIPYYGMLSYARLANWEDAAVEARRLVSLLAQYERDRDDSERALHASMQYLAGVVFQRAGERGEAAVAYRLAHAVLPAYSEHALDAADGDGDVLVVVERGFVAHRTTETLDIALRPDERESLRGRDDERDGVIGRIARRLSAAPEPAESPAKPWESLDFRERREVMSASERESDTRGEWSERPHRRERHDDDDDDERRITIAFPLIRRSARPWGGAPRLEGDSLNRPELSVVANLDDASAADERRERSAMVTRAVTRAAAKYALAKAVRDKTGRVGGAIADVSSYLLERADVRSWHLLPQEVVLLRARVAPGVRTLRLDVGERDATRHVTVGRVTVAAGGLAIVPVRLWRDPPAESVADSACTALFCH